MLQSSRRHRFAGGRHAAAAEGPPASKNATRLRLDGDDGRVQGLQEAGLLPERGDGRVQDGQVRGREGVEAPAGWHWGSKAEVAAIMGGGKESRQPRNYYYFDRGGWNGCTWGSVTRSYFLFSDTLDRHV